MSRSRPFTTKQWFENLSDSPYGNALLRMRTSVYPVFTILADADLLHYATCLRLMMVYSNVETHFRIVEMVEEDWMEVQWEWNRRLASPPMYNFNVDGLKYRPRKFRASPHFNLIRLNKPVEDRSVVGAIINKPWRSMNKDSVGVGLIGVPNLDSDGELVSEINYSYAKEPVFHQLEDIGQWLVDRTSVLLDYK